MGVLLDTSVLFAFLNAWDTWHEDAKDLMRGFLRGEHGRLVTTSFTLDELAALGQSRQVPRGWGPRLDTLIGPRPGADRAPIELIHPSGAALERAHRLYVERYDQGLSLTDWVQLVVMAEENIDKIATFDQGFQGLAQVVRDPGT